MKPVSRLILVAWPLAAGLATAAPPLRMLYSAAVTRPMVEMDDPAHPGKLTGGFTKVFGEHLAAELGTTPVFMESARKRVEPTLLEGGADLICNANPTWFGQAKQLGWTNAVFSRIETVVSRADDDWAPQHLADLAGHRLGTILGYRYPQLETDFASGRIDRRDEVKLENNFRLLDMKGIDALVSSQEEIGAFLNRNPSPQRYRVSGIVVSQANTYCAVSKRGNWTVEELNRALQRLQQNGKLPALRQWYGLEDPRP